jgi:TonB-dependent starch-binding outer membrane protein SusC
MNIKLLKKRSLSKLLIIAVFLLSMFQPALAGNNQLSNTNAGMQPAMGAISGKVTDETGTELMGVTVMIKGSNKGITTDAKGIYRLEQVNAGQTLVFSFVGMKQQEILVGNQPVINVVMVEESTMLSEVIAVGYGNQQKKDITGSVSSVKSDNFNTGLSNSPEQLIQGKVSGVNVTSSSGAPGSGQRIIIRGQGSLRENTGPLYVIDGFPLGLGGTGTDDSNPYNFLNPEDIESIDVLKDASAAAIYGTRGANGVILITTKSGKAGTTQLSVTSKFGISNMAKKLPVFNADEFRSQITAIGGNLVDGGGSTDWQDELTRTAYTQDHLVSMLGGNNNLNYRASFGYMSQQGILINTGIERYSANLKASQKLLNGKLNIDYSLNTSIEKSENTDASYLVSSMLTFNPTYTARDANGDPVKYTDYTNPLIYADLYTAYTESRKIIANISPSFEIIKGLVYKLNFGYENDSKEADLQTMPSTDPYYEGSLEQQYSNGYNTMIENYLTYTLKKDVHNLTLLAGHSYQKTFNRYRSWSIDKFEDNGIEPRYNPGLGQMLTLTDNAPSGWAQIDELQSFFGRANYSYLGKYLLTATLRADGSSKFGDNNKYGIFPSFAAGWRISEEEFMKSSGIDNLKLRIGWGQTGNQEIPSKITQASYTTAVSSTVSYPLNNSSTYYAGTTYTRLSNPDIQWEISTQSNVGLDFGFFKGALSGTIDYFHKVSSNILLEITPSDPIQPASTYWTNVKDMTISNDGIELALDYQHKNVKGFSYGVGGTASYIKNIVENSPFTFLTTGSASGSGLTGATINGLINGYPVGSFYMREFLGIGDDGLSVYANDEELKVVGCAIPDFTYSFYLNLGYKRFDLSANFNGVSGNKIYNNTAMNKFYKAMLANSSNTTAKAVEYSNESIANAGAVSTRYLEDGSYLRLNNLTLGYNFDVKSLGISQWIKDIRLSLTGQNLFVITKYSGYDPEVNQNRSMDGYQSFGIDLNSYPKARTFSLGLNVTFN